MPRCKICKQKFEVKYDPMKQKTCLESACLLAWNKILTEKSWKKEKKEIQERHMKFSDWLQLLQNTFNTYIRLRDAHLPCISCDTTSTKVQYCAGHFYTRGAFPNLRFDEDNVHKQCNQYCNNKLSGNIHNYRPRLIERIGIDRFNSLEVRKQTELKISIPEIKEKIKYYKNEIKKIQQA